MTVLIGTSGWHYQHWRHRFYPTGMGTGRWLDFYCRRFATVEVNNAFYRLPEKSAFEHWREIVPQDFVVAVKASRYLTHIKRLREPDEPVQRLLDRVGGLGPKLGPILLQFPPTLRANPEALRATLRAFGRGRRIAVEPRHPSWFTPEIRELLEEWEAALCLADGGPVEVPFWRTTDWGYVRFHRGRGRPTPCYTRAAVREWAAKLMDGWARDEDVFCYFNNDTNGCALRDARWLAEACADAGYPATRVPTANETRVG